MVAPPLLCTLIQYSLPSQVYDLLNPTLMDTGSTPFSTTSFGRQLARPPQQVLKVRWNRRREFYLENVFEFQCATGDEALEHFRFGVNNKVGETIGRSNPVSRCSVLLRIIRDLLPFMGFREIEMSCHCVAVDEALEPLVFRSLKRRLGAFQVPGA